MKAPGLYLSAFLVAAGAAGTTFTVTNTNDSGAGSLRQAILDANANPGGDTIAFGIPGAGVHTITPATGYGNISDTVLIDGYSQPGASENTAAIGTNAVLLIELDGSTAGGTGIQINGANASVVQGLVVNRFVSGINVANCDGCVVRGNFLGTDPSGQVAQPNSTGVEIGSIHTTVGGTSPGDRNLVSGNTAGVFSGALVLNGIAVDCTVQGNLVGTDATGLHALPNSDGIAAYGTGSVIGGSTPGAANVVSGNGLQGMWIEGSILIQGNLVGVAADGVTPLGNGGDGINIHESTDSVVGGIAAGEGNEIAFNGSHGVDNAGVRNAIRGNSIHDNRLLGINDYTGSDTPKPNDPGDTDAGSNDLQNFPIIQSATTGATTHIVGKFNSTASTTFDLDFYASAACSNFPREFLEGQTFLGSTQVTTDGSGNASVDVTLLVATETGARISATATDPNGNTSEFSQRIIFSMDQSSGPASGGIVFNVHGTDLADPATMTIGGVSVPATFIDDHTLSTTSPALSPGTVNDVVVTTPDGTMGTLSKGWVADFLDVPGSQQFYAFVTTLVSNGITVGVGGGNYGVDAPTLRQQMAVFILKAKHGLCYTPPPCVGMFEDVPCSSNFAPWIEAMANEGITGGCGGGNFCPTNPVRRDQMAVFLMKGEHGSSYVPPPCQGIFGDVQCPSTFADWIEQLSNEQITGGCGGGNYCPSNANTRGQMAVFLTKTFHLQ